MALKAKIVWRLFSSLFAERVFSSFLYLPRTRKWFTRVKKFATVLKDSRVPKVYQRYFELTVDTSTQTVTVVVDHTGIGVKSWLSRVNLHYQRSSYIQYFGLCTKLKGGSFVRRSWLLTPVSLEKVTNPYNLKSTLTL